MNHPNFKLHMDVKAQSGEIGTTVPELIRRHAQSAGHFHAQDVNLRGPGMGNVDFGPIMNALVDSGYDRWVSVEVFDFSPGPRKPQGRASNVCGGSCQPPSTGPDRLSQKKGRHKPKARAVDRLIAGQAVATRTVFRLKSSFGGSLESGAKDQGARRDYPHRSLLEGLA